jgi:phospholipase D1/2
MADSLFRPGENCAAVAHANRAAFIVDAEDYFRAVMQACEKAERSIVILGWDFDSRTPLCNSAKQDECVRVGDFLDGLAKKNRHLRIHILDWDYPLIFGTDRESSPRSLASSWKPHRHIDFQFDDTHPVGGSHHQKIIIIDGKLAFSGGLDLTGKRWDTRKHTADDPRRTWEDKPYPPFHDVMIAVDGEAARALAKVACERWKNATGEPLSIKPVKSASDPWPEDLPVAVTDVQVAVSCTFPKTEDTPGVHHVEKLYLDMIESARDYIYIENQYFTSQTIGAALKKSLAQPKGPEIIVVTRLLSHGWLEEVTMTALRTQLVRDLRDADQHGRLQVVYPDVRGLCEGTCLDIHSKVMAIDDEWLRIGSANLSNRSMGMDTECDVTIEAQGDDGVKKAIRAFRDCLLAEHSDCQVEDVAREVTRAGNMAGAIKALGTEVRRFKQLEAPELSEAKLALAKIGDPEAPVIEAMIEGPEAGRGGAKGGFPFRKVAYAFGGVLLAAIILALVWTHTPLADMVTRENAAALGNRFSGYWWAPLLVIVAYTPASFIMFPRWLVTMTAVIAFGPWKGFVYAMTGVIVAAIATFLPGRLIGRDRLERYAGPRLKRVAKFMQQRGLIADTAVRLVPIAPFPVINMAMGALRVRLGHFMLGTLLGMLPGMLAATVLSDQLAAALEEPARVNGWLIAAAILALATLAFFGQRMLRRSPQ